MTDNNANSSAKNGKMVRNLGLGSLIIFGIAYFQPLAFVGSFGVISVTSKGHIVLAIMVAGIAMLFSAFSYRQMVQAYPYSGSAYIYTSRSINPHIGFLTGWGILMDYMMLPMANSVAVPIFVAPLLPFDVPRFVLVVIFVALITIPNILGIKVAMAVNYVLLVVQFLVIIGAGWQIIDYVIGGGGAGTLLDGATIINLEAFGDEGYGCIITAAAMFCINFIGFDAVTTIAEEAKNPVRDIRKAVILIVLIAMVLFTAICYLFMLVWPEAWMELTDTDTMTFELCRIVGGAILVGFIGWTYAVAQVATSMSSMAAGSRIFYAMGRDGILPKKFFGHLSGRGTPVYNILLMCAVCFVSLMLDLETVLCMVSFGALFGFTMVNISVIMHFFVKEKNRKGIDIIRYLIVPAIGTIITVSLLVMLSAPAKIFGCAWLAAGFVYMIIKTRGFKEELPQIDFSEIE